LLQSCCGTAPGTGGGVTASNVVVPTPFNTSAPAITQALGRGINVGNELDAEPNGEGSWTGGVTIQQSWFDDYTNAGFSSVRIPVTWGYCNGGNPPVIGTQYIINTTYMARVKQVVDWALSRNLYVVLNCHHEDWLYPNYTGGMTNFTNIWQQIATEFASESSHLVFEVLNEPQGNMSNAQVNDMNTNVLAIIRGSGGNNATRWVIVGADSYNAFNRLTESSFSIPNDGATPHLIANFHYYNPWNFCGMTEGTWGMSMDKQSLLNDLSSVRNWANNNGNIPVYMGEYGAADGCNLTSRWAWYDTISADANNLGFAYAAWDDFGSDPTSFQIFHRTLGTFDQNILNGIF
jgi:endoglucanase